jgi:hypothetical protein
LDTQEQTPLCRGMVQLSHKSQIDFVSGVKTQFPEFFEGGRVLEIGSLDINGSVRDFFVNCEEYVGCDLGEGKALTLSAPAMSCHMLMGILMLLYRASALNMTDTGARHFPR